MQPPLEGNWHSGQHQNTNPYPPNPSSLYPLVPCLGTEGTPNLSVVVKEANGLFGGTGPAPQACHAVVSVGKIVHVTTLLVF